jgi:hypothetical protein
MHVPEGSERPAPPAFVALMKRRCAADTAKWVGLVEKIKMKGQ